MSKVMSVRVSDECAAWAASYAEQAGVKRQVLLENAVESFRELCAGGTPELRSFRDEEGEAKAAEAAVLAREDRAAEIARINAKAARGAAAARAERERRYAERGW